MAIDPYKAHLHTEMVLPMICFIPEKIEKELRDLVGEKYYRLTELERIILACTHKFCEITNTEIQYFRNEHPRDIGECLKGLVKNGYLERSGRSRGTRYTLPNQSEPDLFRCCRTPSITSRTPNITSRTPNITSRTPNIIND